MIRYDLKKRGVEYVMMPNENGRYCLHHDHARSRIADKVMLTTATELVRDLSAELERVVAENVQLKAALHYAEARVMSDRRQKIRHVENQWDRRKC